VFHSLLERVRHEVSGKRALESVRALTRFHRVQSSPGYDQASSWMARQLESLGLEIEVDTVPGDGRTRLLGQLMPEGWECSHAMATLVDGDRREHLCDYQAETLSLILRSAPARGRYVLVDAGEGTEASHYQGLQVANRVVLIHGDVHRVHELAVKERGAAGILSCGRRLVPPVRDALTDPDALAYTSFWWEAEEPRGWGFVISPRAAARVRERLAQGAALELEVEIQARSFATPIPLLSARLPGTSASEVLVVSHLCHPQPSANDNASGAAANLETARVLARLQTSGALSQPRHGIRFLWVPELNGSHAFLVARRDLHLVAALNLDMVGEDQDQCGSTLLLEHPPCFAASFAEELLLRIREQAVDWVPSYSGPGHYSMMRMAEVPYGGGSDHAALIDPAVGVPCPMLIQWPDRFYHSSLDTPDKTDPESLALAARCAATYAGFIATLEERGQAWLTSAVARGARRRLLQAMDEHTPRRAVEREWLRGRCALRSLSRLAVAPESIVAAERSLEEFSRRETGYVASNPDPSDPRGVRRPHRLLEAPLPLPRRLIPGYRTMPLERREHCRQLERETPDAHILADVGWSACDGRRTLEEIAHLVELETGRAAGDFLQSFFDLTSRLGISDWTQEEAACSPSEPHTAGR
jgi:hypothetical protein